MSEVDIDTVESTEKQEPQPNSLVSVSFAVPGSLADLSSKLDKGLEVIKAREQILATARKAALRMTSPEDWLLFKDKQGRVIAYLQDCGADRVRDIFGIEVFNVSKPEKLAQSEGSFLYVISGSGRCSLTQQTVEGMEGGRCSTDDFITSQKIPPTGAALELMVRKSARANLDGNITRELSGLKSVPLEEIEEAYKGSNGKSRSRFREARGFGTQAQREQVSGPPAADRQAGSQATDPSGVNPNNAGGGPPISEQQRKRMYAIWKNAGWQDSEAKDFLLREYNFESSAAVTRDKYEEICLAFEGGGSH